MDTHAYILRSNTRYTNLVIDGKDDSEAIKGSNRTNSTVDGFMAIAGYEDGIDCVRGSNYTFRNGEIHSSKRTRTHITIKGGVKRYTFQNIELYGLTRFPWQISIGDHTIYNKGKLLNTDGGFIDSVHRANGKPVRILVLDGTVPECVNGNYIIWRVPRFLVKLWFKILG
jgi:hypothetical protein